MKPRTPALIKTIFNTKPPDPNKTLIKNLTPIPSPTDLHLRESGQPIFYR
jgi:hypothetical protein